MSQICEFKKCRFPNDHECRNRIPALWHARVGVWEPASPTTPLFFARQIDAHALRLRIHKIIAFKNCWIIFINF